MTTRDGDHGSDQPERERHRLDVVAEVISVNEQTRVITQRIYPDPRRYDRVDGGYYDKLEDMVILDEAFESMVRQMGSTPVYFQRPLIDDSIEYVKTRETSIAERLQGASGEATFDDPSAEELRSLLGQKLGFAILSIDLVGSTQLADRVDPVSYRRITATLQFEVAESVTKFHGQVLKYTGDGLIAYFAEPSFNRKNDMALDCALTLRWLVYHGIDPALEALGLPTIDVRIGMDSGDAFVDLIGSPATKQEADIQGLAVNLAVKVEHLADPGEITVGEAADRSLHVGLRDRLEPVELPADWPYKTKEGRPYRVFRVGSGRRLGPAV